MGCGWATCQNALRLQLQACLGGSSGPRPRQASWGRGLRCQFLHPGRRTGGRSRDRSARIRYRKGLGLFYSGIRSAILTAISLVSGAKAPGVRAQLFHLGATLATAITRSMGLPGPAAARFWPAGDVAARSRSFQCPICRRAVRAGSGFLGHYATTAFVPIGYCLCLRARFSRGSGLAIVAGFLNSRIYQITSYSGISGFLHSGGHCLRSGCGDFSVFPDRVLIISPAD